MWLLAFLPPPFSSLSFSPQLVASQPSQPLSATYHHIPLWILTPVWSMPFILSQALYAHRQPVMPFSAGLSRSLEIKHVSCVSFFKVCFGGNFNDWMRKHQLQSLAGGHFLFHHTAQSVSCFPSVGRSECLWHVLLHVILKAHAHVYPRKSSRISLCVCYVTLVLQWPCDTNGPAVWSSCMVHPSCMIY